jgi:two-component system CheB/CheR fusion protein
VGRPISDIVLNLKYERLVDDVREVLSKLLSREIHVETGDNRWYMVRILPYRTIENAIDGVVITFTDITDLKKLEEELQALRRYSENIVDTVREPLVVLDAQLRVISANRSFYAAFKVSSGQVKGQLLYTLGNNEWDIPQLRQALQQVIGQNKVVTDFMVEHDFRDVGHKKMLLNARMVLNETNGADMILLAIEDVTDRA